MLRLVPSIRKGFLGTTLLLLSFALSAQKPCSAYQLNGNIKNAEGQWLIVKSYDYVRYNLFDSVQVKNGEVSLSLPLEEPTSILLICGKARAITLLGCGLNTFTWDVSEPKSFSLKDNGVNPSYQQYHKSIEGLTDRMVELSKHLRAAQTNSPLYDSLWEERDKVQKTYPIVTRAFIRAHPAEFTSLYLLRYYFDTYPTDTIRSLYAGLGQTLKQYPSARTIREYLDLEKKLLPLQNLSYSSGKDSLAGFAYYVVDFWGTWCGPCIASIPAVKELYGQYRPKNVQFVSLAYEKKNLDRYFKAQTEYGMPWPQAYVVQKGEEKTLIDQYYVAAFPTYLILDSQFRIRQRIIGSHEQLAAALKKLKEIQ